jgi:hypothetical protein
MIYQMYNYDSNISRLFTDKGFEVNFRKLNFDDKGNLDNDFLNVVSDYRKETFEHFKNSMGNLEEYFNIVVKGELFSLLKDIYSKGKKLNLSDKVIYIDICNSMFKPDNNEIYNNIKKLNKLLLLYTNSLEVNFKNAVIKIFPIGEKFNTSSRINMCKNNLNPYIIKSILESDNNIEKFICTFVKFKRKRVANDNDYEVTGYFFK